MPLLVLKPDYVVSQQYLSRNSRALTTVSAPPLPPIMSLASSPALPAVPIASNSGLNKQNNKDDKKPTQGAGNKQRSPPCQADHKKARIGLSQAGHIILTPQLLHFLHKAPDKGIHVIAKIAHRQIVRSAACAEK